MLSDIKKKFQSTYINSLFFFTVLDMNLVVMEQHLELVEVEPALGLPGLEVVVEVPRREAEGVELLVRGEEENCRRLLVVDTCRHHVTVIRYHARMINKI